jgi:hypothetical protein
MIHNPARPLKFGGVIYRDRVMYKIRIRVN